MTTTTAEQVFTPFGLKAPGVGAELSRIPPAFDLIALGALAAVPEAQQGLPGLETSTIGDVLSMSMPASTEAGRRRGRMLKAAVVATAGVLSLAACNFGGDTAERIDCTTISPHDGRDMNFNPPGDLEIHTKAGTTDLGFFKRGPKQKGGRELLHSSSEKGAYKVSPSTIKGFKIKVTANGSGRPAVTCPR
ncbi:MAG TPA: hypothetical protein VLH38_00425 [Patescibacteria group bacterium]|nr:hypothetical protein [Patescibacteria group bacterium]